MKNSEGGVQEAYKGYHYYDVYITGPEAHWETWSYPISYGTFWRTWKYVNSWAVLNGNRSTPQPWSFYIRYCRNYCPYSQAEYRNGSGPRNGDVASGPWDNVDPWSHVRNHQAHLDMAYAQALERMNEKVRGNLDVSVDLLQANQLRSIIPSIKSVAQSANKHLLSMLTANRDLASIRRSSQKLSSRERRKVYRRFNRRSRQALMRRKETYSEVTKDVLTNVGSIWLTWVYGIKPTLQTIYDASLETHYRLINTNNNKYFGRATVTNRWLDHYANVPTTWNTTVDSKGSWRYHLQVQLKKPGILQSAARITSLNPASIAWELMPYSFVVDWFYNIGGYLRDLETAIVHSRSVESGFATLTYRLDATMSRSRVPSSADCTYSGGHQASAYVLGHLRSILDSYPLPRAPRLMIDLGSGTLLNAAALLTTFLR